MKDDFLPKPSFLQSAEWEKLQNSIGRKTWNTDNILLIQHPLPFDLNYLYCPNPQAMGEKLLERIGKIATQEKSVFLKIEPVYELRPLGNYKYQKSYSLQPRKTTILDLRQKEEELLAKMHAKTRYNIRLAERCGVQIRAADNFATFWSLLEETSRRAGFYTHKRSYYENLFIIASENFSNEPFFAEYQGRVLAAALVNFYRSPTSIGGVATYLHGASIREHKEVMASHLLHWYIIKEAKKRGLGYYDFWGIDEKKWPGITRFKLGFGGEVITYQPAVDIIYRPGWYKVYRLAKKIKT